MGKNCCYILYSVVLNKFYVGETENLEQRLEWHNSGVFKKSYTKITADWVIYLVLECNSRNHARKVEAYIKRMKSKQFIMKLKDNIELQNDIILMCL